MNTDGNLAALNRYEKQIEENEKQSEREIKEFRDSMDEHIDDLIHAFNVHCKSSNINRNELKEILLEDLENGL